MLSFIELTLVIVSAHRSKTLTKTLVMHISLIPIFWSISRYTNYKIYQMGDKLFLNPQCRGDQHSRECSVYQAWRWDGHFLSSDCATLVWPESHRHRIERTIGTGSFQMPSAQGMSAVPQSCVKGESWSPTSAEKGFQAHSRDDLQAETARPTNTRYI